MILESGRARAESTVALARCFPAARVVSVEFAADSPDVPLAAAKLAPHRNVECLFGDSRELLPPRLEPGVVVLIDGPKEFRALKLALRPLRTGKPAAVFMHDFGQGCPERAFLERHWPGAFFSDHPEFLARYAKLDGDRDGAGGTWPRPKLSAFACLPAALPEPHGLLLARAVLARTLALAPRKPLGRGEIN